jgi:AcrR family transcriptional regulator
MNLEQEISTSAPDLRERRRREMTRVIANAAVELFEGVGVAATTVDDIAAAAGISRTTFFRYCSSKEAAVLVDDAGLEAELIRVAARASGAHPRQDLEEAWEAMTAIFDADPEGHNRFLRVRRLMNHNQSLLAAGLQLEAGLSGRIGAALHEQAGLAELDARAVAAGFAVAMRLTFDEWVRRVDEGFTDATLCAVYREVRDAVARAADGGTR